LTVVDFYLGLGSRYSYLAASQVDRLEAQYGCRFAWKPIASGALIDRRGDNPFRREDGVGQYDPSYREYDAKAWAAHYGIPLREPAPFDVEADVPALACLAAERQGAVVPCCRRLFELIFAEGIDTGFGYQPAPPPLRCGSLATAALQPALSWSAFWRRHAIASRP